MKIIFILKSFFSFYRFLLLILLISLSFHAQALQTFDDVKSSFQSSQTHILDRQGEMLQTIRTDLSVRRGDWIELENVSSALRLALVFSEDKRFYEHSGVDWQAVGAAAWGRLWNQRTRGASTLTMQLAGLLDEDWRVNSGGRTVSQKIGQTWTAKRLEQNWRKDQILEAYLNLLPFRGELVGIDALSHSLFAKAAHGLDEREAAIAVALIRSPNTTPEKISQRACYILRNVRLNLALSFKNNFNNQHHANNLKKDNPKDNIKDNQTNDCLALDLFVSASLERKSSHLNQGIAPHFARQAIRQYKQNQQNKNSNKNTDKNQEKNKDNNHIDSIRTTIDVGLQRFSLQSLHQHLRELRGRNVEDGAIVVLDNASGAILAWVGSSGELSQASEVDAVLAKRQAGSTLKPFLYAQALAEKRLTAASLIEDSSAQIATTNGLYIPQNYDKHFRGWVSARTALASSLNVPAVRILTMISPDSFHRQLNKLGLELHETGTANASKFYYKLHY